MELLDFRKDVEVGRGIPTQVILKRAHSGVANIIVDSDERRWRCKIAFEEMKATDINCFATAT